MSTVKVKCTRQWKNKIGKKCRTSDSNGGYHECKKQHEVDSQEYNTVGNRYGYITAKCTEKGIHRCQCESTLKFM